MQKIVRPEDYPHITTDLDMSAKEWLTSRTVPEIVEQQNRENEEVWRGVKAFIETNHVWDSFVLEGIAILPRLVHEAFKDNPSIKPIFLLNDDRERIKEVIYTRGLWADAHTYSDEVKPIEVEWAILFNEWIKGEAEKYEYPTYQIQDKNFEIEDLLISI